MKAGFESGIDDSEVVGGGVSEGSLTPSDGVVRSVVPQRRFQQYLMEERTPQLRETTACEEL